jgi:hypothetical protein
LIGGVQITSVVSFRELDAGKIELPPIPQNYTVSPDRFSVVASFGAISRLAAVDTKKLQRKHRQADHRRSAIIDSAGT